MLEWLQNANITNTTISFETVIISIMMSLLMGVVISLTYQKTSVKKHSDNLALTLILLPTIIGSIVMLIGNNVAGAFSLAGIFSVIRFRSSAGNARDILFILFSVGAGLAVGVQTYLYGLIFTVIMSIVLFVAYYYQHGTASTKSMQLRILVPEDLNDEDAFNDILTKYTMSYSLISMRTKDLGSVYELMYIVDINGQVNKKEFLDNLRCRNGNLNISLNIIPDDQF